MFFRRIITRFGQLPLLFLVRLLVTVSAIHIANMIPWDQQLLMRLQTSDASMIYGGVDRIAVSLLSGFSLFCSYALGSLIKRLYFKPRPKPQPYTTRRQKIDA